MIFYTDYQQKPNRSEIGGKGFHLFRLQEIGLRVPAFAVLGASSLTDVLGDIPLSDPEQCIKTIEAFEFSTDTLAALKKALPSSQSGQYAVRSSAIPEDGSEHSFAGQFESYLYVTADEIPHFIKEVWKSIFSERVVTYVNEKGLPPIEKISVIIQVMIDPEVSGVAFGANPHTGDADEKVICSVYGVGEGIVSGTLNADTYTYANDQWKADLVQKAEKGMRGADGQVQYTTVPKEIQTAASLDTKECEEIKSILEQLNTELNAPQDIEFAILDEELYLLQTRPVTGIKNRSKENRIIWDNSNIVESYPGVTTPLTFSYIRSAYRNVYQQLALLMGASQKTVDENEAVFANMLGLIRGRVYYNLLSWYRVLALFPGYSLNARFMETMMGVKERFDLERKSNMSKLSAVYRTGVMLLRIAYHLFTIKKTSSRFLKDVNAALQRMKDLPIDEMSVVQLKRTWIDLDTELTPKWKAPLINDSFAMIYFGRLKKFIEKYQLSENPNVQNDLLCGSQDIISVEPIHKSIALATSIQRDKALTDLFLTKSPEEVWEAIKGQPIQDEIMTYIDRFGDRCVGELKLETISFKQDPSLFIQTLQSFVRQNVTTASTASGMDLKLRSAAEKEVFSALQHKPYKKYRFKKLLLKTRYFVSNRENLRYERTRVFGITRTIFSAIGDRFAENQLIENPRDIFYLSMEEIFDYIDGTAVQNELKPLIATRKVEFQTYEDTPAPSDRITTYGAVPINNDFYAATNIAPEEGDLTGQGCCPGVIKAKVRIVHHPGDIDSLDGDILVTTSTDPGWVTLFPTASAILVERGSLLSHSAIVSREMGIPCIVGVNNLLNTLKDGELVEMNGSTGIIKRLNDEG